ncbi:uncharacterized protein LOC128092411 [Culex pipiens pallens]|uniref:uncharacterized protein LOC128092411 n=1 Tax=Culex pipiens pallens TaxID=42434 RepID=UPI0022AB05AF|nr:uncharacterized protein LOC128092411 [Culex pipiens pallens]
MSKSTGTARITAMFRSSKPATATNHTNTYHEIFDDKISTEKVISETSLLDEMGTISRETSTDIGETQGVSVLLGEGMVKICIRHTFQPLTWASTRQPPVDRRQPEQTGQTNDFNQRSPDEPAAAALFQKFENFDRTVVPNASCSSSFDGVSPSQMSQNSTLRPISGVHPKNEASEIRPTKEETM